MASPVRSISDTAATPSISHKDIDTQIRSITAEQIQSLAKKISGRMAEKLKLNPELSLKLCSQIRVDLNSDFPFGRHSALTLSGHVYHCGNIAWVLGDFSSKSDMDRDTYSSYRLRLYLDQGETQKQDKLILALQEVCGKKLLSKELISMES